MKIFSILLLVAGIQNSANAAVKSLDDVFEKLAPGQSVCYESDELNYPSDMRLGNLKKIITEVSLGQQTNNPGDFVVSVYLNLESLENKPPNYKDEIVKSQDAFGVRCVKGNNNKCGMGIKTTFAVENENLVLKNVDIPQACSLKNGTDECSAIISQYSMARQLKILSGKGLFKVHPMAACPR